MSITDRAMRSWTVPQVAEPLAERLALGRRSSA